jgi:hypothetical protein
MRKKSVITPFCSGLAILAGSFSFIGDAQAVTLLSEGFEGTVNVFGTSTYNYAANYTLPNLLTPGGGLQYMKGGPGITGAVSTNTFSAGAINLLTGGITGGDIDGGTIGYNIYAQFSSYLTQGDYATLAVQFLDAASSPLGSSLRIGGEAFTAALPTGAIGSYTDAKAWGADSLDGIVPLGARFATVQIIDVKTAGGTAIDGYMDNITFTIAPVPEPSSVALLALGGGLALLGRRRR